MVASQKTVEITFMRDPHVYFGHFKFVGDDGFSVIEKCHYTKRDDVIKDIERFFDEVHIRVPEVQDKVQQ